MTALRFTMLMCCNEPSSTISRIPKPHIFTTTHILKHHGWSCLDNCFLLRLSDDFSSSGWSDVSVVQLAPIMSTFIRFLIERIQFLNPSQVLYVLLQCFNYFKNVDFKASHNLKVFFFLQ